MITDIVQQLVQFGVAGMMGVLWVWERFMSRHLIKQINESHECINKQKQELSVLIALVEKNTQAIEQFNQTQNQLKEILENIHRKMQFAV